MSYNTAGSTSNVTGVSFNQAQLDEAFSIINGVTDLRWAATTKTVTFSSQDFSIHRTINPGYVGYGNNSGYLNDGFGINSHNIGINSVWLRYPIQSITSFTIGGTAQVEGADYELNKEIGQISLLTLSGIGGTKDVRVGDMSMVYVYGYGASHNDFAKIQGIEARIALLLKSDPLLVSEINLQGDACKFGDDPLGKLLKMVPKTFGVSTLSRGFSA